MPITSLWVSVKFKQFFLMFSFLLFPGYLDFAFCLGNCFSSFRLDIWIFISCFDICILFFCLDILILIFCFGICILSFALMFVFSSFALIFVFYSFAWKFFFLSFALIFVFSSFFWIFGLVMTALSDLHIIFNSNVVRGIPSDHFVSNIWEKSKLPWLSLYFRIFNHCHHYCSIFPLNPGLYTQTSKDLLGSRRQ